MYLSCYLIFLGRKCFHKLLRLFDTNYKHLYQVRYLDLHVRWDDLGRPELIRSDGKSSEAEASAFRNTFVCGKKTVNQEVRYCVAFGSRKHLPSRVMKNITEIDQILENGKERYWFSETFIPLYLIREYEQKVEKNKSVNALSKLQRRQLKASRENIFSSLLWKQGNTAKNCCSCHQDIFYRYFASLVLPQFYFLYPLFFLLLTNTILMFDFQECCKV